MDYMQESQEAKFMPTTEVLYAGNLTIGKEGEHQISSSLEAEQQVEEYAQKVKNHLVTAEEPNTAVCMDGRGCRCLASDVSAEEGQIQLPEYKKPPIRPEMAGGLVDMATMSALLADWSGLGGITDFNTARTKVADFLTKEGYVDAAHTSDVSLNSDTSSECGAHMKKLAGMQKGVAVTKSASESGEASPLDAAVAAYNGLTPEQLVNGESNEENNLVRRAYRAVRSRQKALIDDDAFESFDPIATRDELRAKDPSHLEILFSDASHPTHNHKEPALVIIDTDNPNVTVDRDAMYEADGFAPFVDNRNKRREIANLMGSTEEEKARLLIAGDVTTVDVSDELVAPGMPVIVVR